MTSRWTARFSLLLYFALLALVAVNLARLFTVPLEFAAVPVAIALTVSATAWFFFGRGAFFAALLVLGSIGLLAVAVVLAVPAWQVIASGASRSWAGQMAPLFVAALALHACNLSIGTIAAGEQDETLERLARLVYGPGLLQSLITALILCAGLVLGLELLARGGDEAQAVTKRFLERGIIPPLTALLFFWGALLLLGKWWNGWYLRRQLRRWRNPARRAFTGGVFVDSFEGLSENNLAMEDGLQMLWRRHEESWLIPRYLSWAVPILGFIGTVLGISLAAEGIRRIIASDAGLASLSSDLDGAIAPLGIAFDTTLIALSLSVVLTLLLVLVQRGEERLLTSLERRVRLVARGE